MNKWLVLGVVCSLALGCKGDANSGGEKGGDKTAKTDTPPETKKPAKKRTKLSQKAIEALLDQWLEAQNSGDFEAYSKLYAKKFNGVKRVGAKTSRYARKDWLNDRKRMFRKKMTVEAQKRRFNLSYSSGMVTFTQRWASGTYEDLGPKRILAVLEDGALKIAQEEMIASDVLRSKGDKAGRFYFLQGGGIVLHDAAVPAKHGTPKDIDSIGEEEYATMATVVEADLDESVLAWKGKKVRVDGECETTVTGFKLVSRVTPHFGTEMDWNCTDGGGEARDDCEEVTEADKTSQAFGEGGPQVIAELADCDGTYARLAEEPKIIVGDGHSDKALEAKALAAFQKLKAVTKQAENEGDEEKEWSSDATVQMFKHPKSGQILVAVHANNGGMCGEFSASGMQVWEVKGGKLKPIAFGSAPKAIVSALDTNRDGVLELLVKGDDYGTELTLLDGKTLESQVSVGYAYHDTPC